MRSISSSLLTPLATAALMAGCGGDDPPQSRPAPSVAAAVPTSNPIDTRQLAPYRVACMDFDDYVNGQWRSLTPMSAEERVVGTFQTAMRNATEMQRRIASSGGTSTEAKLLKAFYDAGMNRAAIERAGATPVLDALARIDAIGNSAALVTHLMTPDAANGASALMVVPTDGMDANGPVRNMATVVVRNVQGSPEFYGDTAAEATGRERYISANAALLRLAGIADAEQMAKAAFDAEARIAANPPAGADDGADWEEPQSTDGLVTVEEANKSVKHIDWAAFFIAQGVAQPARFMIYGPDRIENLDRMIAELPLSDWKALLKVWALQDAAPYLSTAFREAMFRHAEGDPDSLAVGDQNWLAVMNAIDRVSVLRQSMSVAYAKRSVTPHTLEVATRLVDDVRAAFRARLEKAEWLSPAARAKALEKERLIKVLIAPSEAKEDVSPLLAQMSTDHFANVQALQRFDLQRRRAAIGTKTDLTESDFLNQSVNAFYQPNKNLIVINAAILQAPVFDPDSDAPFNYGGLGSVIGHELSHGFDTTGAIFDGHGIEGEGLGLEDMKRLNDRAEVIVKQFNAYEAAPGLFVDGELTRDENIADLGGVHASYDALQARLASVPGENRLIDGMTPQERFFVSYAHYRRVKQTPAALADMVEMDPHAPDRFRINGSLSNMEAFAATFRCEPGQPMARKPEERVVIW